MDYLSEKIYQYKKLVKVLRDELNNTLKTSILDEKFNENLNYAKSLEREILEEIIPLYRQKDRYKADISISKYKKQGTFTENGFIEKILPIDKDIYLITSSKKNIRFLIIDRENKKYEFTDKIKNLNEKIIYLKRYDDKIYIFTVLGEVYRLGLENLDGFISYGKKLNVERLNTDSSIYGFENIVEIDDYKFINIDEDRINLLLIDRDKIINRSDIYLKIDSPKVLGKIKKDEFLLGDINGYIYLIKYENNKFTIKNKLEISKEQILSILIYSLEDRRKIGIISSSDKSVSLVLIDEFKLIDRYEFSGNIYRLIDNKSTVIALSDIGQIHIFEENLSRISLNINNSLSNKFISEISSIEEDRNYLAFDLDTDLFLLDINRLESIEDLNNISLYE